MPSAAAAAGGPRLWAVVPIKRIEHAKQRLSGAMPAELRREFVLTMLDDVLCALSDATGLAGIAVVTRDASAAELAARYAARVVAASDDVGYTQAVAAAARRLAAEGASGVLAVPGDIPLATADEFTQLIAAHRAAPAFSIVPAHDRRGSNAIVCSPPGIVPFHYGDDSFRSHLRAAEQAGLRATIVPLPGIGRDIDRPDDVTALAATPSATRTWAFLQRHGLTPDRRAAANGSLR